jgi:hypothetical protein
VKAEDFMNKSIQSTGTPKVNSIQKARSTLDPRAIERLKDLALDNRVLDELEDEENMTIEELEDIEQSLDAKDPNFSAELTYDGYKTIEAYDNDEFRSDVGEEGDDAKELNFSDRVEDESITEEKINDKQDNLRDSSRNSSRDS